MVLLSFDYPPNDGGIARFCAAVVAAAIRLGIPVQVVAPHAASGSTVGAATGLETRVRFRRPWREWDSYRKMRHLRVTGPVVSGLWYPDGLLALLARTRPLVIMAHGSEMMPATGAWRRGPWEMLRRRVCEAADLIVANSEYTRKLVLRSSPKAKVVAIPLGVDHKRFTPEGRGNARERLGATGKLVLSSVSRLQAYKGHGTVLQALAVLPETTRQRFVYLIAGKGPHGQALRNEAVRLGVASAVRWLGFVPEEELPDLYRSSDLFVLCTRESPKQQEVEGFGLVFLESQACGTPVLGTRTGGIPDAIREGEGGWLIDQDDATALAGILTQLADAPAAFRAAGLAARRRIERECTWEHYVQRFRAALGEQGIRLG